MRRSSARPPLPQEAVTLLRTVSDPRVRPLDARYPSRSAPAGDSTDCADTWNQCGPARLYVHMLKGYGHGRDGAMVHLVGVGRAARVRGDRRLGACTGLTRPPQRRQRLKRGRATGFTWIFFRNRRGCAAGDEHTEGARDGHDTRIVRRCAQRGVRQANDAAVGSRQGRRPTRQVRSERGGGEREQGVAF